MAEKSEKATPKKLRDARKKGQVSKSQDMPAAFTFITAIGAILLTSSYLYGQLSGYLVFILNEVKRNPDMTQAIYGYLQEGIMVLIRCSFPLLIAIASVGVIINFLVIGPVFSMQAMKPDIKRLNPVTNLKNIFKLKTLFELTKSILKISIAVLLIISVIWNSVGEIAATVSMPILATMLVFNSFLTEVLIKIGIFFVAVAVIDLMYQKKNFAKEMRMEKYEVKQEYKDTEGDPHIKGRRRSMQQEIAYQEGPSATRRSHVVLTNPEHFAVALEYDDNLDPAPKIATMGKEREAMMIIDIALESNIPIFRNPELTRSLYYEGTIGQYIPEEFYRAVAQVLKWVNRLKQQEQFSHIFDQS